MPTLPEPFRAQVVPPIPALFTALDVVEEEHPDYVPALLMGSEETGWLLVWRFEDATFLAPE